MVDAQGDSDNKGGKSAPRSDGSRHGSGSSGAPVGRGYWAETWVRFWRRKLSLAALSYVALLTLISILSPALAGTKPIVCKYKGKIYFPAMGYFKESWENPIFMKDRFRKVYPKNLKAKDPESWAIWPLLYQDPYRRIREGEWEGQPENETEAGPNRYNLFGTNQAGFDVLAQMIHGTQIALLVGFVSTGVAVQEELAVVGHSDVGD